MFIGTPCTILIFYFFIYQKFCFKRSKDVFYSVNKCKTIFIEFIKKERSVKKKRDVKYSKFRALTKSIKRQIRKIYKTIRSLSDPYQILIRSLSDPYQIDSHFFQVSSTTSKRLVILFLSVINIFL